VLTSNVVTNLERLEQARCTAISASRPAARRLFAHTFHRCCPRQGHISGVHQGSPAGHLAACSARAAVWRHRGYERPSGEHLRRRQSPARAKRGHPGLGAYVGRLEDRLSVDEPTRVAP
jgi:hypothetical protein